MLLLLLLLLLLLILMLLRFLSLLVAAARCCCCLQSNNLQLQFSGVYLGVSGILVLFHLKERGLSVKELLSRLWAKCLGR